MEMTTSKKEKNGLPFLQWASLMVTIISLIGGVFVYITNIEKRVSMIEQETVSQKALQKTMQETLVSGRDLRIQLEKDVENIKENMKLWRDENTKAHDEIKRILDRLSGYKTVSLKDNDSLQKATVNETN